MIPGLARSPGEGNGNPLQYSCLRILRTREPGWGATHTHIHTSVTRQAAAVFPEQEVKWPECTRTHTLVQACAQIRMCRPRTQGWSSHPSPAPCPERRGAKAAGTATAMRGRQRVQAEGETPGPHLVLQVLLPQAVVFKLPPADSPLG